MAVMLEVWMLEVWPDARTGKGISIRGQGTRQDRAAVRFVLCQPGFRMVSAALQAFGLWCSFWAGFIAGMSITGDWI
jgi:hypothetical protein